MLAAALRATPALAAVLVLAGGIGAADLPAVEHSMTGFTAEQEAQLEWGIALFEEAGLALPAIDFVRDATVEPCHGRRGWFQHEPDRMVVHVCIHDGGTIGQPLIVHEIAHAWDSHTLTDERRERYLEWRGLTQWWGQERAHWAEYGAEQAAEVLVWGLFDRPIRASQTTPPYDECARLRTAFVLLTGDQPLHGYEDRCRAAPRPSVG